MFVMTLLLLRPLGSLRQRGSRHSPSSFNGTPIPLRRRARRDSTQPEPTSLGSASTRPQKHRHEFHPPKKKHCLTRDRQRWRSRVRVCKHPPEKSVRVTRGRHRWWSRVPGCLTRPSLRQRCYVSQGHRHRRCKYPPNKSQRPQHQRMEDPLILRAACKPWKLKPWSCGS